LIRWLTLGVALLVGGCASLPKPPPERPEFAAFALNGRVSISYRDERHSAGLHWTHRAQSDEILLLTPLGQTAARLYRDDRSATLEANGKYHQATNIESLMRQSLGWYLPMNGLHHWVLGMHDPEIPARIERDEDGRIAVLHQGGWEIHYLRYEDAMPSRMQLDREDMQVKLLIDEWDWSPQ